MASETEAGEESPGNVLRAMDEEEEEMQARLDAHHGRSAVEEQEQLTDLPEEASPRADDGLDQGPTKTFFLKYGEDVKKGQTRLQGICITRAGPGQGCGALHHPGCACETLLALRSREARG